jgi:anti-sigma B factor antagonist
MSRRRDDSTLGGSLRPRGPIQLALTTRYEPDATVVAVRGELDALTAPRLATRLDEIVRRRQGDVVIDLTATEFVDSLGLYALLKVQRRLTRQSRQLTVICESGPVLNAIELGRLSEPLGVVASFADYELRRTSRS